jgi:hypothetical protein
VYHRPVMALLGLVIALIAAACGGGSETQIRKTAAQWFTDSEKAAGQAVREVTTTTPMQADMGGVRGWEVSVSGIEDATGQTRTVFLFIDGSTLKVTEMASGSG